MPINRNAGPDHEGIDYPNGGQVSETITDSGVTSWIDTTSIPQEALRG